MASGAWAEEHSLDLPRVERSRCGWCDHDVGAALDSPVLRAEPARLGKLVTLLRREGADAVRRGGPWGLQLEDRSLLMAAYAHEA